MEQCDYLEISQKQQVMQDNRPHFQIILLVHIIILLYILDILVWFMLASEAGISEGENTL